MMRRSLLILLVACTLVVAMVPRNRRAEDTEGAQNTKNPEAKEDVLYCATNTPCAWSIYNKQFKNLIELNVTNTYCICTDKQECAWSEDNEDAGAYVFKCTDKS